MATVPNHHRSSYKRACDLCGHPWPFYKLTYIGQQRWACEDDYRGLTAEQLSRLQMRMRPLLVKPRPHAKLQGEVPQYVGSEAFLFNLICRFGATAASVGYGGYAIGGANVREAGSAGIYLAGVLAENKRPLSWMRQALSALMAVGTFMRSTQYGDPSSAHAGEAVSSVLYGGLLTSFGTVDCLSTANGGLTFLALWSLTGDATWLAAADRVAAFLRNQQRSDARATGYSTDSAATRLFVGAWPLFTVAATKVSTYEYDTAYAMALWFCARYRDARGAGQVLGLAAPAGDFTSATQGSVQDMIDDAIQFYVTGKFPYAVGGSPNIAPLSATTPQSYALFTGPDTFQIHDLGFGLFGFFDGELSSGLRGLYELEGYTPRVAAIFEWLMSFTSNPAWEIPDGANLYDIEADFIGTYDPTVAIAAYLATANGQAQSPTLATNALPYLSLRSTGLLGPLYNASGRDLRTIKDAMAVPRFAPPDRESARMIGFDGICGLSFQSLGSNGSMEQMAQTALIYRAEPKGFPVLRGV